MLDLMLVLAQLAVVPLCCPFVVYVLVRATSLRDLGCLSRRRVRRALGIVVGLLLIGLLAAVVPLLLLPRIELLTGTCVYSVALLFTGRRIVSTFRAQWFMTGEPDDFTMSQVLYCIVHFMAVHARTHQRLELVGGRKKLDIYGLLAGNEKRCKPRQLAFGEEADVQIFFQDLRRSLGDAPGERPLLPRYSIVEVYNRHGHWRVDFS